MPSTFHTVTFLEVILTYCQDITYFTWSRDSRMSSLFLVLTNTCVYKHMGKRIWYKTNKSFLSEEIWCVYVSELLEIYLF